MAFSSEAIQRFAHQVHGSQGMMKAGVQRAGVHQVRKSQLTYSSQPLKNRLLNQVVNQIRGNGYKPINRIIDNFSFVKQSVRNMICIFVLIFSTTGIYRIINISTNRANIYNLNKINLV